MKGVSTVIATILMLIITIALAGMAYMYIAGVFTSRTQGIEVVDAYCVERTPWDNATMTVRNIGTSTIDPTQVTISRTAPTSASISSASGCTGEDCAVWGITSLTPGNTTTVVLTCPGSGGRSCQFRLTPPIGGTVTGSTYCT